MPKKNNSLHPVDRINWQVGDFCAAHGIGKTTFSEEVKRGDIKISKVGKRTLIPDDEAKAWQTRRVIGTA